MPKLTQSTITWFLSLSTVAAFGVWIGLFVYRAREQQQAIATLCAIEITDYMCVLPAEGVTSLPAGTGIIRSKVTSPVEFSPHGPAWLRTKLGEDRCRNWIDSPIAVNLTGSEAYDSDMSQLACFPSLKKLNLLGSKVTPNGLVILRRLPELEELHFGSGRLTDVNLDCLERLKSLKVLTLIGNIGDTGVEKLRHLPKLTDLHISSSAVTDKGLKTLAEMGSLERLSLSYAMVTDSGVRELSRLPRLKQLYLGEIPGISEESLNHLREERPWLAVSYEPFGPPP